MKKLLVLALVSGSVYGGYRVFSGGDDSTPAMEDATVIDRIWIDRIPRTERDTINVFFGISNESVGLFNATSQWRGNYELFRFESNGGELQIVYPQTGDRERVTAKATKCDTRGFDFCLELSGASRGVKKYYSMEGWEIDGGLAGANAKLQTVLK